MLSLPLMAAFGGFCPIAVSVCQAQESAPVKSIQLAPIDADFYYGSYRMSEQWERFLNGPVVKELMSLPVTEKALEQFRSEWREREGAGSSAREVLDNGNFKDVLAFFQELAKSDVFVFGDKNLSEWNETAGRLNDEIGLLLQTPQSALEEQGKVLITKWIGALGKLEVPTLVIGARCDNEDMALGKIDQLEIPLFAMRQFPEAELYVKELKRIDDGRGDRLQWVLNGSMIPWDTIPTNSSFDDEMRDALRSALNDKSLTLTLGMFDGHFVFAISSKPASLLQLGKGKSVLEHPDMQPIRDMSSRSLTSISYVSDAFAKSTFNASYKNFFSRLAMGNGVQLLQLMDEKSELRSFFKDVVADLQWADESIGKLVPEFKGLASVGFLTDDGWERHDYYRTKDVISDGSAPLASLDHVGEMPLLMAASRVQDRPEYFQLIRKLVQKGKARFDLALELDWTELNGNFDRDEVKKNLDRVWPMLVRVADVMEKKLLPALSGEHAIVLSGGNLAAKQWFKDMPISSDPLPLPELATLTGLKDEQLFKSGFADLFDLCDDLVKLIREQDPNSIPAGYTVPRPGKSDTPVGEKYGYPIPADCPVPAEMMPQGVFAGRYLIGSYSDKQSLALAKVTKLTIGEGTIDSRSKQSQVSYIHVGRLFEFARPWIRYGLAEYLESLDDSLFEEVIEEEYAEYDLTGKEALSLWGVPCKIGEFSSSTTPSPAGGTHTRSVYRSQKSK
jgi:hypothetical protein